MARSKNPPPRKIKTGGVSVIMSGALFGEGPIEITLRSCVLCGPDKDCDCASVQFGSDEYFARVNRAHGK